MKVLKLVKGCGDCPNKTYYSGGVYECSAAQARLPSSARDDGVAPAWCPLTEYPAAAMNDLVERNAALQEALRESRAEAAALRQSAKPDGEAGDRA